MILGLFTILGLTENFGFELGVVGMIFSLFFLKIGLFVRDLEEGIKSVFSLNYCLFSCMRTPS